MPRGPAPTPKKVLERRGSWRAKLNPDEPQYLVEVPEIPDTLATTGPAMLADEAAKEWERITAELEPMGLVAKVDRSALSIYCEAWAEFLEAVETLKSQGKVVVFGENNNVKKNPWVEIRDGAAERVLKLAAQFGFTPSARTRIKAAMGEGDAKSGDERFFRRSG